MAPFRAQLHVSPRGRLEHPEIALAPGPAAEAEAGDGSLAALYGQPWALVWDVTRPELVLCRVTSEGLEPVVPVAPLPRLTVPARHIALAFDPTARPVIAWQGREGIYVRQWSTEGSAYTVRGPFPGQDPVLVFDGVARRDTGGGDVTLYHLTGDRSAVVARLERDEYGVAYDVAALAAAPSGRPWYLDQVVTMPWRLQIELATDEIEDRSLPPAQWDLERARFVSDVYPIEAGPAVAVAASAPARGEYHRTTYPIEAGPAVAVAASAPARGEYHATTEQRSGGPAEAVTGGTVRGDYVETIAGHESYTAGVTSAVAVRGEYRAK